MKVKVNYGKCSMYVLGMDMNCPLCGEQVLSGMTHMCEKPEPKQLAAKPKRKKLAGESDHGR